MSDRYLIGIDFGTASARGVLVEINSGKQVDYVVSEYQHGVISASLPNGDRLPSGFALHHPADYIQTALDILTKLGRGKDIAGIGIASTASSPMPARADGSALVKQFPNDPQAYVKLWKHARAQPFADDINEQNRERFLPHTWRISGEGLIAKAAETRETSPAIWDIADKFIEVGDWIVWQLTGGEFRSADFACFKALYSQDNGFPNGLVAGLEEKLSPPHAVGSSAGRLSETWVSKTGIIGTPVVSVASIDSHAVLPAVGVTSPGTMVGVLGTSSGFIFLDSEPRALPEGFEASAFGAALPNIWCCEAGQAGFGDTLGWFIRTFPCPAKTGQEFDWYNGKADMLKPGQSGLIALDWFGGNRVPYADKLLSGCLIGLRIDTSPVDIYRALIESLAFGVRAILERGERGGLTIERVVLTSAIARGNSFLVKTICDVLGRAVYVPNIEQATAMGAAIHAAVANGTVASFKEGASRFGCREYRIFEPDAERAIVYDRLYADYFALCSDEKILKTMRNLSAAMTIGDNLPI